jgi:hypothetical protein
MNITFLRVSFFVSRPQNAPCYKFCYKR